MLLSFFHRFLYLFKRTLISCRFEHDLRFLSKKNYTTLPYLRGLCFMHVMMWLYARHVIFFEHILLHKACIEGFCFEKNMLKFVCWFYFRVLAVLYFLPWFQVTFWEGVQTMRKSANNAHLDDVHEMRLSRHGQWLLSFGNISILTDTQLEPQFFSKIFTPHS